MKKLLGILFIVVMSSFLNISAMEYYGEERAISPELEARIQREEQERKLREFEEQELQRKEEARRRYIREMREAREERNPKKLNF